MRRGVGWGCATGRAGFAGLIGLVHWAGGGLRPAVRGAGARVEGGEYYTNTQHGIYLSGSNAIVDGAEIYGNRYGVRIATADSVVRNSQVHDNTDWGIYADYGIAEGNVVFGHSGANDYGIGVNSGVARGNQVFGNERGIQGSGTVEGNRVHSNTWGINMTGWLGTVEGNQVYANTTGIWNSFFGVSAG